MSFLSLIVDGLPDLSITSGFDWRYEHGTTSAADFVAGTAFSGTVSFAPGITLGRVDLGVKPDSDVEPDETGQFVLTNAQPNGTRFRLADGSLAASVTIPATIVNDDQGGEPPVLASLYHDDFETPGALGPQWTGATNAYTVNGGALKRLTSVGGTATVLFADALTDQIVDIGYDTSGPNWDNDRQFLRIMDDGAGNYLRLVINAGGGDVFGLNVVPYINDVAQSLAVFFRTFGANRKQGTIRVQVADGIVRVAFDGHFSFRQNGVFSYPYDIVDLQAKGWSASPAPGKVGVTAGAEGYPLLSSITVDGARITLREVTDAFGPTAHDAAEGSIVMKGRIADTVARWIVRLWDDDAGTIFRDWSDLAGVTVTGGSYVSTVTAPADRNWRVDLGYVDADGETRFVSGRTFGGEGLLYYGQSNGRTFRTIVDDQYGQRFASYVYPEASGDSAFPPGHFATQYTQYRGSLSVVTAQVLAEKLGRSVLSVTAGQDASRMTNLIGPNTYGWESTDPAKPGIRMIDDLLKCSIAQVVFDQGEAEADTRDYDNIDPQARATDLITLRNNLATQFRNPDLIMVVTLVGNFADSQPQQGPSQGWVINDRMRQQERQGKILAAQQSPYIRVASSHVGIDHGADPYHFTVAGNTKMARRNGYSLAKFRGADTPDGRGPLIYRIVRDSARVLRVKLLMNGASSLSDAITFSTSTTPRPTNYPAQLHGFHVSNTDDFAALVAISDIRREGTDLLLDMAVDLSATPSLRYMYGGSYIDDVTYHGLGYADGREGIPIFPTVWDLKVGNPDLTSRDYGWPN